MLSTLLKGAILGVTPPSDIVNTPTISAPNSGATGISIYTTITSSAYSVVGTPGTHLNSDWEIYSNASLTTLRTSSMASTVNLTSWRPTGLLNLTQYWVRVRYRSSTGIESNWSPARSYTTGAVQVLYPLAAGPDPTYSVFNTVQPGYVYVSGSGFYVNSRITNASNMFGLNSSFNDSTIATWNTASFTNTAFMFDGCSAFNVNIAGWNVSNVTSIANMFSGASSFNANISSWNTAKVTDMKGVFKGCTNFNQPIGNWNTSNVTSIEGILQDCSSFNRPLNWDTAKVTRMLSVFNSASVFNQPLNWDTSKVTRMDSMFNQASAFNQNISSWNVSNVTSMGTMFRQASSFNQNLSSWVTGMSSQPSLFSAGANTTFANNANNLKPFLSGGIIRINT
jgi:surface protein